MTPHFDGLALQHWHPRLRGDGVLVLALDRAGESANALAQAVLLELHGLIERICSEPPRGLVICSGKKNGFIAGADIREFADFARQGSVADAIARGQNVFEALARLPCPTVAAIDGFCMGGGTELALACDYRIASDAAHTRIGLPEVKLGIFPGWGGSVRLPRLIGAPAAFDLMLTGRSLKPGAARAIGLVDAIAPAAVLEDRAAELALRGHTRLLKQRLLGWASNLWPVRQLLAPQLRKQVARKVRQAHYPAPFLLIDTWRRAGGSMAKRLAAERRGVVQLATTPTARNLVRVFFLQEQIKALGQGEPGIAHVHVVGAGVMGGDIAAWSALKGFEVTLQDRDAAQIERARQRAAALFAKRLDATDARSAATARLRADSDGSGIAQADLFIEAIVEQAEAKRALFAEAEPQLKPGALLCSNTSSIPIAQLSEGLAAPERFAGLHYFNPVALMPLVEIVRHPALAPGNIQRLAAFCRKLDKFPIVVAASPGFLVNRVLFPYLLEAMRAYAEGISPVHIDQATLEFGMPMGAMELLDTVGLDVAASVGAELAPFLGLDIPEALRSPPAAGQRGKKDGQGIYRWENGKPLKPVPQGQPPQDLQDRLLLPLVNEAVACLAEGVVATADLLDAGVIFGTGFAPFRGGPIQYVRDTGTAALLERLATLERRYGSRFAPRPGWAHPALHAS